MNVKFLWLTPAVLIGAATTGYATTYLNVEQLEAIELLSGNPLFAEPRSYNISHDAGFDIPKADLIGAACPRKTRRGFPSRS